MSIRLRLTYAILAFHFLSFHVTSHASREVEAKKINCRKHEDYTFEGDLTRAMGECSYLFLANDATNRNKTIQMIKEKAMSRNSIKRRGNVDEGSGKRNPGKSKSVRKKTDGEGMEATTERRRKAASRYNRNSRQRSRVNRTKGRGHEGRRIDPEKGFPIPSAFSTGSFTDHNNCSSRCIFARMGIVNVFGYPDESMIAKLIDDRIRNLKVRLEKKKKVATCFGSMQKVAYTDSCIISARLSECLEFQEPYLWSGRN